MIISAVSVISPYGLGTAPFIAGIQECRPALSAVPTRDEVPYAEAGTVGSFDVGALVEAGRGTGRIVDRPASLAVGAVALMLRDHDLAAFAPAQRAVVLGSSLAGTDRAMGIMRDSLTQAMPFYVKPSHLPANVMSHAGAECALKFGFKGPNTTVTAGRVTGLSVLAYARRIHRKGRGAAVIAGAVEDLNPQRSWLTWHGGGRQAAGALGEGCCVFLTESRESADAHGRAVLAEVLALEFGLGIQPSSVTEVLTARIGRALHRAGLAPEEVSVAAVSGPPGVHATYELAAVSAVLGDRARVLEPGALIGDTDGASAAFQLAAALAYAAGAPRSGGHVALVTAVDPDGQLGCGLFRLVGSPAGAVGNGGPHEGS